MEYIYIVYKVVLFLNKKYSEPIKIYRCENTASKVIANISKEIRYMKTFKE